MNEWLARSQDRIQVTVVGIFVLSTSALLWPRLQWMADLWMSDGPYSYGALVPIASGVLGYLQWRRVTNATRAPATSGIVVTSTAILLLLALQAAASPLNSLTPLFIATIAAGTLAAGVGWAATKTFAGPLSLLLLLVPLPPGVLVAVDMPSQSLCARVTTSIAHLMHIPVKADGTLIVFADPSLQLYVAPACDGIRSLLAMLFLSAVYMCLVEGRAAGKTAFIALALPVGYAANIVRLISLVVLVATFGVPFMRFEQIADHAIGLLAFAAAVWVMFKIGRLLECSKFREI